MDAIIKVENLKKYFKEVKAVDDISFSVERGELFGFLGVNGAGKSTTINMMCTLFRPTAGEIVIDGCLAGKEDAQIRKRIGVVWQNNCLDDKLTVKENLYVRGALFGEKRNSFREHVTELCERLQLQDVWSRRYENLSGGQKRRCEIAAALLNRPEVLFLDEPTTGSGPGNAQAGMGEHRPDAYPESDDGLSYDSLYGRGSQGAAYCDYGQRQNKRGWYAF